MDINEEPLTVKNAFVDEFGDLKPGTFHSHWYHCRNFFDFLMKNNLYEAENPIELVPRRKLSKKEPIPFTESEVDKILEHCPAKQKFLYEFLLNTGIRVEEFCQLNFSDLNYEIPAVLIRGKSSGGGAKGDKDRLIPIPDLMLEKYKVYLADIRSKQVSSSDYVFLNRWKHRLNADNVYSRMKRLGKKIGIHIHPHRFRYTYARKLAKEGVHITVIQKLLGHESIETTARYIAIDLEDKIKAQEKTWIGQQEKISREMERLNREKEEMLRTINEMQAVIASLQKQVKRLK